ncbi:MAG: transporter substrate-binding domain-containing protein [Pseudomonadales bacterium]|nr:transporter substrate-binding domain-containing protein [Pseudomonadales bacterium]
MNNHILKCLTAGCLLWRILLLSVLILSTYSGRVSANSIEDKTISICSDANYWFPYTFDENGASRGLHVDIVTNALTKLGIKVVIEPLPWKRCLFSAKKGKYDAVISASFKQGRAEYLYYPEDAALGGFSKQRLTQVEYTILTLKNNAFEFDGDFSKIPEPVRVPLGYSIADDLSKKGLFVKTSTKGIYNSLRDLVNSRTGSIVTTKDIAMLVAKDKSIALHISSVPIKSKSYFMAFSKKAALTDAERAEIWEGIAAVRGNAALMSTLLAPYGKSELTQHR